MMTREKMKAIQRLPKSTLRVHSCSCGDAPNTKPEHRTTQPLRRGAKPDTYVCATCGREA